MPAAERERLALLGESLESVLANRLEQGETALLPPNQTVLDQHADLVHRRVADGLGGLCREAAGEHGDSGESLLLRGVEQAEAPVEGRSQGLLARRRIAASARQQRQTRVESIEQLGKVEEPQARRGELDCERQVVEPGTERDRLLRGARHRG